MLIGWNGETLPALPLDKELEVADLARHLQDTGLAPLTMNGIENINFRPPEEFIKVKVETLLWAYW